MAEQTQPIDELETLRRTNSELVTKNSTRKQRISELEAANAELQKTVTDRDSMIHSLTIGAPLKAMAEDISKLPDTFIENFSKSYRLELANGEPIIVSVTDGKPVMKDGKPVPFERGALMSLLLDEKHPQSKLFNAILIASKASGGDAPPKRQERIAPKPAVSFGLR